MEVDELIQKYRDIEGCIEKPETDYRAKDWYMDSAYAEIDRHTRIVEHERRDEHGDDDLDTEEHKYGAKKIPIGHVQWQYLCDHGLQTQRKNKYVPLGMKQPKQWMPRTIGETKQGRKEEEQMLEQDEISELTYEPTSPLQGGEQHDNEDSSKDDEGH